MPTESSTIVAPMSPDRSPSRIDGRRREAKRLRALTEGLVADLKRPASVAERELAAQAAQLILRRES